MLEIPQRPNNEETPSPESLNNQMGINNEKPEGFDENLWGHINENNQEDMPTPEFSDIEMDESLDEIEASPIYQQEMAQKKEEAPDPEDEKMSVSDILKDKVENPISDFAKDQQKEEGIWEQIKKSVLTTKGLTQTAKDMPRTMVKGAVDTIGAVSDFLSFVSPFSVTDNIFERVSRNADIKSEELGKEMNIVNEAISSVIIPYGGAYGAAVKIAPSAFKIGTFGAKNFLKLAGKQAVVGASIAFVLDDPKQDNIVKMLKDSDTAFGKVLPDALANNDTDTEFESRIKNALVGAATDATITGFVEPAVQLFRFIKTAKKIALSPEGKAMREIKDLRELPYRQQNKRFNEDIDIKDMELDHDYTPTTGTPKLEGEMVLDDLPEYFTVDPLYHLDEGAQPVRPQEISGGTVLNEPELTVPMNERSLPPYSPRPEPSLNAPSVPIPEVLVMPDEALEFARKAPRGSIINKDGVFYANPDLPPPERTLPPAKGGEAKVYTTEDAVKEEATKKVWKTFEREDLNQKAELLRNYYSNQGLEAGAQKIEISANKLAKELKKDIPKQLVKDLEEDKLFLLPKEKPKGVLEDLVGNNAKQVSDVLDNTDYIKKLGKGSKLNISTPVKTSNLFRSIYKENPFTVIPTFEEDEKTGQTRIRLGLAIRPDFMGSFARFGKGTKNYVRNNGGKVPFKTKKGLVNSINKAILKESRGELASSGVSTLPTRAQKRATPITLKDTIPVTRKFRKMGRDFDLFKGQEKVLSETFIREAPNFNVGIKDFDMTEFAAVTKEATLANGAIANSPELAIINYLKHIQPVKEQIFPKQLADTNQTLLNKSNIERAADQRIGTTKDIGQYRDASINEFVEDYMNLYTTTINDMAVTYAGNKRLRQAGIHWPRKGVLRGANKAPLPPAETEQVIAMFKQAEHNTLGMVSDNVAFRKATSAQGVELQNLKPESKEAMFIMSELKKNHKPGELVNILAKNGVGADMGLHVEIDPVTGAKSLVLKESLKSMPERAVDLIVENLVSQVSTSFVVLKAGLLHTAGDIMLRAFMRDLQNVVKYGKGALTGDGWQKLSAKQELGEFKRTYKYFMESTLPAFSDFAHVLIGKADANALAYNIGDKTSVLDAFKGSGNMQKLLKAYKQTKAYKVSKEKGAMQGFAFAQAPEFVLQSLNATWGIGKLQSLDAFFKRLWGPAMISKYARLQAMDDIGQRLAKMPPGKRKLPTKAEIASEVNDRILIAQDNFKAGMGNDDVAVKAALDELNRGLFRSKNTTLAGTDKWNIGDGARKITDVLKELPGVLNPFGRLAGIFSEVVLNSSDYFVQRVPGLNFINPTIRAEWESFARPEVIAKSLAGASIGMSGWFLYLKQRDLIDITDSFDERRRYREVNGFFPNGDVIIQTPIFGKKYTITPLLPVGESLAYGAVMANYYDKFKEDGDFSSYLGSVVGKTAEKVMPVDLFTQYSEFFEFFKELKEADDRGGVFRGVGKATQKLLDTGFLKEIKDYRRGFKLKQDSAKGVIAEDLSSVKEDPVFFNINRIKTSHAPVTDWDRHDVPDYDWRGRGIKTKGEGGLDDYFAYISRLKGFEKDNVSKLLWDIQEDASGDSLKLVPTDRFDMKEMYLSQMMSSLDNNTDEFIRMKQVLDTPEYKTETKWRLNNQQHRLLKKLASGKSITVPVIHKGKEIDVKVDFKKELQNMSGQNVGTDFRPEEYAMLRKHQEAYKILTVYGADKEMAVKKVTGEGQFEKIKNTVNMINNANPPMSWVELRENIQTGMNQAFKNVIKENPSFETPEGTFMFNRLVNELETGQFEGSGERKKQANKNMRIAINQVVEPYNKLAKTIFLFKVLGKSDVFLQKVFNPEKNKAIDKFKTGEYDQARF